MGQGSSYINSESLTLLKQGSENWLFKLEYQTDTDTDYGKIPFNRLNTDHEYPYFIVMSEFSLIPISIS